MRVAWMDANDNSIAPLEQTFSVNLITPYTEEVVVNPCASAVATMKTGGNARDKEIAFTLSAADMEYQNRTIEMSTLKAYIADDELAEKCRIKYELLAYDQV
jgi:hypothetical protein